MIEDGDHAPGSISNHLKITNALFNFGLDNYLEKLSTNPLARVKYSPGDGVARDDFTTDERGLILTLARQAEPHIYWLNYMCSYHGSRTGEIADMSTLDLVCIDEIGRASCRERWSMA